MYLLKALDTCIQSFSQKILLILISPELHECANFSHILSISGYYYLTLCISYTDFGLSKLPICVFLSH